MNYSHMTMFGAHIKQQKKTSLDTMNHGLWAKWNLQGKKNVVVKWGIHYSKEYVD